MKKKLMAVAVAGAFAAPAVALAQASTVQIYGTITYEYGIANQGRATAGDRPNVDYADTPGGTSIGFRGEEKLGGGLSAWFQCESSADVRAMDQTGFCTRNSAVGFKGSWGNLHFGRWDTPLKRALGPGSVGGEETGLMGMSFLPWGGSGGADATESADEANRHRWKRREAGLTYYESPVFNGFQVLAAFGSGNFAANSALTSGASNQKPRVISLGATYSAGPLGIGLGYEKHNDFNGFSATAAGDGDDKAWGISLAYRFGTVEVGGTYLDAKYETGPGLNRKKKTWTLGADWRIQGPHSIEAMYAKAGDTKGNDTAGAVIGGNGGISASGSDTGGDAWQLGYTYSFSKRTRLKLAYTRVDNDRNTTTYRIGNTASVAAGEDSSSYAFRIVHRF